MKLLLLGATGLVGQAVLKQALAENRFTHIVALTRKPVSAHPKLENPLVDFDHLPQNADWWKVDAVICTLGTTMRQAGSKEAFRRVDFEYPLAVAKLAKNHGASIFSLNSATGANPESRSFYNRTKGEIEAAIRATGFTSATFVRPGLISGDRKESRPLEDVANRLLSIFRPLIPKRYRPVSAEKIAAALVNAALEARPGCHIIESEAI